MAARARFLSLLKCRWGGFRGDIALPRFTEGVGRGALVWSWRFCSALFIFAGFIERREKMVCELIYCKVGEVSVKN
jgi:hypothetical protein